MRILCLLALAAAFLPGTALAKAYVSNYTGDVAQATTCANGSVSQILGSAAYNTKTGVFSWSYTFGANGPLFNDGVLTGGANTASHFHGPAAPGVPANIQVGTLAGTPSTGSQLISAAQASDLLSGLWYLNIHNAGCGGGELRGQVTFGPITPIPALPVWAIGALAVVMFGAAGAALRRGRA